MLEDFVWREAGWVGLESGNVGQRRALHEAVDACTERGAAKKDLAPQILSQQRLVDPLVHEASGGGPSGRYGAIEQGERGGDVEPAWRCLNPGSRSITTPRPPSGFCHHSSSHWIQHDLAAEFLEGTLLFHEQTFEPALQQVSQALMATIEPLGVGAMESA